MFYTKVGILLASIGFVLSVFQVGGGLYIAVNMADMSENVFFAQRYFAADNSGEIITRGTYGILASVTLGILCEISRGVRGA
ncbi:hypothetical protein XMV209_003319 [Aliiroseovarius sp. xm-v-209]|nr:hypothetical protein [Aliiroseovarius sp. xm-m-314]NRP81680.1 hypothetical protein [Aliiroseovarius sp. xm-v-209]NRQ12729.1 hypothetical protein [Aliiroseovarius sp. xm-v-208]